MSTDFGASISEEPSTPAVYENIRQDQFGRTVIELNQTQKSSTSSSTSPPVVNGHSSEIETKSSQSIYSENNNDERFNQERIEATAYTRKEEEFQESRDKELEKGPLDHANTVSFPVVKGNGGKWAKMESVVLKLCKLSG